MMTTKIERIPLRQAIADAVRARLSVGDGLRGPINEVKLAEQLGVSRTPLREALLLLERDGLVRSNMGRGFEVVPLNETLVRETYVVIAELEALAVRISPSFEVGEIHKLRDLNAALSAGHEDSARAHALDREIHGALIGRCGNDRLLTTIEELKRTARRCDGGESRGVAARELSCRQHEQILAALEANDHNRASELMRQHWMDGIETVIAWLADRM